MAGVRRTATRVALIATALVAAAYAATHAVVDPDLWGHLRFGLDALAAHGLVSTDPYSFTQDVPWINHEWLSETVLAWWWRIGGVPGILLMKAAILGGAFALDGVQFFVLRRRAGRGFVAHGVSFRLCLETSPAPLRDSPAV